jgi:hypothetical protein
MRIVPNPLTQNPIDTLYNFLWERILGGHVVIAVIRIILGIPLLFLSYIFWVFLIGLILK